MIDGGNLSSFRRPLPDLVRLGHNLPSFDAISTVGVIQDMAPDVADLYAVLEMTANTTKPLIILISDENRFPDALNLLEHLHGDLACVLVDELALVLGDLQVRQRRRRHRIAVAAALHAHQTAGAPGCCG